MARQYNPQLVPAENIRLTLADQVANGATAAAYQTPATTEEAIARTLANANQMAQDAAGSPPLNAPNFVSPVDSTGPGNTALGGNGNTYTWGGLIFNPAGYISSSGSQKWAFSSGGGPWTATSGVYAGQTVIDAVSGWGYNYDIGGSPRTDVMWGQSYESRYLNLSSGISSEWYHQWVSALHDGGKYVVRRPIQINVAHQDTGDAAERFRVDFGLSAERFVMIGSTTRTASVSGGVLSADRFFRVLLDSNQMQFSGAASIDGNITSNAGVISAGAGAVSTLGGGLDLGTNGSGGTATALRVGASVVAPARLEIGNGGSQALTLYRASANEFLRIAAGCGDAGLAPDTNEYTMRIVGGSGATTRPLIYRTSTDGGTNYTRIGSVIANGGRWLFGDISDDGANRVQVGGAVVSYPAASAVGLAVNRSGGYNIVEATAGSFSGGYIRTARSTTEFLRIGSGRNDAESLLNNAHAIDVIGPNSRPLFIRTSPDGTTYTIGATFNPAGTSSSSSTTGTFLVGSGTAATNVGIGGGNIHAGGIINAGSSFQVAGTQVVTARRTGWTAATGTATRTSFDTATVTTADLAQRVKALLDDLITHGLIGT